MFTNGEKNWWTDIKSEGISPDTRPAILYHVMHFSLSSESAEKSMGAI